MSRSLRRAGHDLVLYNRTPSRASDLAGEVQAKVAATPAVAARVADVCLTMLTDGAAVEAVYGGPDGLVAGARPGSVFVDLSTVLPSTVLGLEAEVRATGAALLDAPVSGSVALAETGQLTIMVGGEEADLERARPVLEGLGQRIFHLGGLGTGAAMKLAINAVIFGLNNAVSECLALAERAGIERPLAYDVLSSSAVAAPYVGYKRAAFLDPDGTPTAFALELAEKDLRLITEFAAGLALAVPQAETNLAVIRRAAAMLGPERDVSSVATYLRSTGGTT
jgi:3-hydroxyisobutyrate dehydrogenase/2-hydroxy-3-oxopropionate reductase